MNMPRCCSACRSRRSTTPRRASARCTAPSERNINFKHPIPVYITYQTAYTDDAGKAQARADIYGLDRDMLRELHGDRRNSDTPIARNYNSSSKPVMSNAAAATKVASGGHRDTGYPTSPGYTTWDCMACQGNMKSAYQPTERSKIW